MNFTNAIFYYKSPLWFFLAWNFSMWFSLHVPLNYFNWPFLWVWILLYLIYLAALYLNHIYLMTRIVRMKAYGPMYKTYKNQKSTSLWHTCTLFDENRTGKSWRLNYMLSFTVHPFSIHITTMFGTEILFCQRETQNTRVQNIQWKTHSRLTCFFLHWGWVFN